MGGLLVKAGGARSASGEVSRAGRLQGAALAGEGFPPLPGATTAARALLVDALDLCPDCCDRARDRVDAEGLVAVQLRLG